MQRNEKSGNANVAFARDRLGIVGAAARFVARTSVSVTSLRPGQTATAAAAHGKGRMVPRIGKRRLAMRHEHPAVLVFGGFLALAAAIGIGRFAYTPILPYMAEGLGISKSEAGLLASANFLGYLLGALGSARAAVPGSRRLWLLSALATSAVTTMAIALTKAIHLFLLFRFAGGVASALVMVFGSALILDRLPARSEWAAVLCRRRFRHCHLDPDGFRVRLERWRLAAFMGDERPRFGMRRRRNLPADTPAGGEASAAAEKAGRGRRGRGPATRRRLRPVRFWLCRCRNVRVRHDAENSLLRPAEHMIWLCVGLAAAPSVALWMRAGRRWGSGRSFAVACLLEAAGVALSALGDGLWLLLAAAALLGGTFMGITALGLVHARLLSAGDSRRVLALMTASFGIGQMVGPLFGGVAYDLLGSYAPPSLVAAAALVAAAILAIRLPLSRSRRIAGDQRTSSASRR